MKNLSKTIKIEAPEFTQQITDKEEDNPRHGSIPTNYRESRSAKPDRVEDQPKILNRDKAGTLLKLIN